MKTAQVTPLLKKHGLDPSDLNNYRPISNLSTISKILEKLISNRIKPHITASPNFSPLQSAYRSLHSTETALAKILDDLYTSFDNGLLVTVASLDLSAAFDTISHSTLQSILKTDFGITGTALNLIHSYLSDRNQFIKIGNFTSSSIRCNTDVPRGSVPVPLLFTA